MIHFKAPVLTLICFLLFSSVASADVTCSGKKLFNNFFEERWVHHDGSVTVVYPSVSVLKAAVQLLFTSAADGSIKLIASVSRQDNPAQTFSGELSLQQDGRTFSAVLLASPNQPVPYVRVTGHFEGSPTQSAQEMSFQANAIVFGVPQSFALEQVISSPEDPGHEDSTRITLQCR